MAACSHPIAIREYYIAFSLSASNWGCKKSAVAYLADACVGMLTMPLSQDIYLHKGTR